jgi:hypothetical protein
VTGEDDDVGHGPLERTVEVLVYAPLGALLEARRMFPEAVDRGRREVEGVLGWLGRRMHGAREEAAAGLRGLGKIDGATRPVRVPESPPTLHAVDPPPDASGTTAPVVVSPVPIDGDRPSVEELAIPDYDSLSASQVVPRLTGLGEQELELVRRYEASGRGRRTILSRIAQLQQG